MKNLRIAAESARFFQAHGYLTRKSDAGMAYIESILPMAVGSVDRLEEITDRLAFLFAYDAQDALLRPGVAEVLHEPGARDVIAARPNAIAFGMWFPGKPYPGHDVDEKIEIADLQKGAKVLIYALTDIATGRRITEPFKP